MTALFYKNLEVDQKLGSDLVGCFWLRISHESAVPPGLGWKSSVSAAVGGPWEVLPFPSAGRKPPKIVRVDSYRPVYRTLSHYRATGFPQGKQSEGEYPALRPPSFAI